MADKKITIEQLAKMINKGFAETPTKIEMNSRFNSVDKRLEKIENLIIANHKKRIEKLEMEVKELREMFAM